jgi:DNA polymerase-3 subunit chi
MTRVDFYISKDHGDNARLVIAARLAEKAVKQGLRVFIHSTSENEATAMGTLLWAAKPASFLPHSLGDAEAEERIAIGWGQEPVGHNQFLINLAVNAPPFFSRFERVAEVVTQDADRIDALRSAWRFYKDRGYPLGKYDV